MDARRPVLVERMQGFGTTIFAEMTDLAHRTGAINLGQGFPDTDGPNQILEAAVAAIRTGANQYPPGDGIAELRHAIADHQRRFYELDWNPDGEVLVTAGATEAITAAILALCEPGDEIVALEPFYDSYRAAAALAGARLVGVALRPPAFTFAAEALESAITERTRLLLVNSPHNPTGRVLSGEELAQIASAACEHDLFVVTDEVYEHLVFDGAHLPLAAFPGMRDRTVSVSSAGKTFSVTGWKIGWITGRPPLVDAVRTVKQFLTYANGSPFQPAVAGALGLPDARYAQLALDLGQRRDLLCDGLEEIGFAVAKPQGTYFATADIRPLGYEDGMSFCRELPGRTGVVAVPHEVFWADGAMGRPLVRFAFCKQAAVLETALGRLAKLKAG